MSTLPPSFRKRVAETGELYAKIDEVLEVGDHCMAVYFLTQAAGEFISLMKEYPDPQPQAILDAMQKMLTDLNALQQRSEALKATLGSLRDVPFPPNIERPEMWDTGAVVQAVKDGFTFLLPFVMGKSLFDPNAYWIKGVQASANALTVGPEHTPEIELLEGEWIRAKTFFQPMMVPKDAWAGPVQRGVVPVYVEIDPDTIDWELLNRGHQIRVRKPE